MEFYCKTHNELCCVSCLCILKGKGKGQHSSCEICYLEDIKEEKKCQLKNNIKILEDLSIKLEESVNILKNAYNKIAERKENNKIKFMEKFTKLRNALNQREDEILSDIDNEFNKNYFEEDLIKTAEKLPKRVKSNLEKGKKIDNDWNDENKLNLMINDCLKIEKNIKDIKLINDNMVKFKNSENNIHISYEEKKFDEEVEYLLEIIKYIFKDDKQNIYNKNKEAEKENYNIKQKMDYLNNSEYLLKYVLSNISFSILSRLDERTCLDTTGQSAGYSPHMWEYLPNSNQIFNLIKNNDGTFLIKNKSSGNYLGLENKNEKWNIVSRKEKENFQKFKLIYIENEYFLIENEKGMFIDVINNDTKNGGEIRPNIKTNSLGQHWKLLITKELGF